MFGVDTVPVKTGYDYSDLFMYVNLPNDELARQICDEVSLSRLYMRYGGRGHRSMKPQRPPERITKEQSKKSRNTLV